MTTEYKAKTLRKEDLSGFIGTTQYWSSGNPLHQFLYTDGMRHVVKEYEAYWILDLIASWQLDPKIRKDAMLQEIQFWKLEVIDDHSAIMRCERDRGDTAITQAIPYTDFPICNIMFYLQNIWCYWNHKKAMGKRGTQDYGVLMLPSEY